MQCFERQAMYLNLYAGAAAEYPEAMVPNSVKESGLKASS